MAECLSIIVPAYNEAGTIRALIERVLQVPFPIDFEILVVDDHSLDGTGTIVQSLLHSHPEGKVRILSNEVNQGKGACIRKGIEQARGSIVMVQDADFEYNPQEIPALLVPILEQKTSVVYGSRFFNSTRPAGMTLRHFAANRFLTWVTNLFFGASLTDMETCYKIIRTGVLKRFSLKSKRFEFEPEVTAKLLLLKIPIVELPISYRARTEKEGKKIKLRDFFIALEMLWNCRVAR